MAEHDGLTAANVMSLFTRQNGCVQCLNTSPTCPSCASGEECQFTSLSCTSCPTAYCSKTIDTGSSSSTSSSSSSGSTSSGGSGGGSNIGAIVGGVLGGVAAMAIVTYLVWRFCIRDKRGDYETESWRQDPERTKEAGEFASQRSERQSAHSVHSVASTVLTRASNIIQIAYIPGVTNRANPASPNLLVPPVPPIPLAHSESGTPSPYEEQHFFVPGDLRDSTYSGISAFTDRTSYAPRSSVASTIYGKNAVVSQMPAQKGTLLKPSIVSVKSRATSESGDSITPPVPAVDYQKYEKAEAQTPTSPAFSIGANFFKNAAANAATAQTVRTQVVRIGNDSPNSSGPKMVNVKSSNSESGKSEGTKESELLGNAGESGSKSPTLVGDTPLPLPEVASPGEPSPGESSPEGPFSDPPSKSANRKSTSSLGVVMADSTRRAAEGNGSRRSSLSSSSDRRNRSPFGDEHAVRD